jgi:hypothetical protein
MNIRKQFAVVMLLSSCTSPASDLCGPGTMWTGSVCVPGTLSTPMPDAGTERGFDATRSSKRAFVSSQRYPANLKAAGGQVDGLASADALCQGLADAESLGGTFRAWLSTSTVDAIDHIQGPGPWVRMDGALLFENHAALMTVPNDAFDLDERRERPNPYYEPWTGTSLGGRRAVRNDANTTCLDWTSTANSESIRGVVGWFGPESAQNPSPTSDSWTNSAAGYCAPFTRRLYCFEQ